MHKKSKPFFRIVVPYLGQPRWLCWETCQSSANTISLTVPHSPEWQWRMDVRKGANFCWSLAICLSESSVASWQGLSCIAGSIPMHFHCHTKIITRSAKMKRAQASLTKEKEKEGEKRTNAFLIQVHPVVLSIMGDFEAENSSSFTRVTQKCWSHSRLPFPSNWRSSFAVYWKSLAALSN